MIIQWIVVLSLMLLLCCVPSTKSNAFVDEFSLTGPVNKNHFKLGEDCMRCAARPSGKSALIHV